MSGATTAALPRLYAIQRLRGIAALLVVCAHSVEHGFRDAPDPFVLSGRFGVEIFFVISGIVILYVMGDGPFDPKKFLIRRIWRIMPLYWLTTLLVAVMAIAAPRVFKTTAFGLSYFVKSLLFIPAPLPGSHDWRPLFKLGWTLNYEVFFYILMVLLFWCSSMVRRAQLLTMAMAALIALSFVLSGRTFVTHYANLNLVPFVVGLWLAVLWQKGIFQRLPSWVSWIFGGLMIAACLIFYTLPPIEAKRGLNGHLLMTLAAGLIAVTTLSLEGRIGANRVWLWLGDISYSLYLTHMFVIGIGWAVLNRLHLALPLLVVGIMALVLISIGVARLSYIWLEKPLMKRQPYAAKTVTAQ